MSLLQERFSRPLPFRGSLDDRPAEHLLRSEASLLSELFRRNGRESSVQTATPPGYRYEYIVTMPGLAPEESGPVLQVAAHPGDGPDFFYATRLQMTEGVRPRLAYHEVLLTDGEGGVDGWSPEHTRRVRREEALAGAEIVGSKLHFLSYPDGHLSSLAPGERTRLVTQLARLIEDIQPAILIAHAPAYDHPDHAASFLLTVAALRLHARTEGRLPALITHDVEFGLQQRWVRLDAINDMPAASYPMHVPRLIVDISSTHQAALHALHQHQTQMYDPVRGQAKLYADLVDVLARVRGLQLPGREATRPRGQAFSQVVIPGVTRELDSFSSWLPAGRVARLIKE